MRIGYLQKTTLIDYPGRIACTIFTQGCNFRCSYCHNPELVLSDKFENTISTDQIFEFLKNRKGKLEGVCITGGEPTIHKDLPKMIKKIKELGFLVKLDTQGSNPKMLQDLIDNKLVDMVSMDIKGPLEKYKEISKPKMKELNAVKESIKLIINSDLDYEFRTTIVKDQLVDKDFHDIGNLIKGAKIYFLQYFIPTKTIDESFMNKKAYTESEMESFKKIMIEYVKECKIR